MKAFVLTPLAARDLNEIWDYLASDSVQAADRVLDALEKALRGLAKNPGKGHWREDLADGRHRFFLVYSYLIVYRSETKPLQVIRVLHASREFNLSWIYHQRFPDQPHQCSSLDKIFLSIFAPSASFAVKGFGFFRSRRSPYLITPEKMKSCCQSCL